MCTPLLFFPPQQMADLTPFLPRFYPPPKISSIWGTSIAITSLWDSRGISDPRREEVFDWVISSDRLPLNDPDTPILLHHFTGSRSSPDIFCSHPLLLLGGASEPGF